MNSEYFYIFKKLSNLHVVPYYRWKEKNKFVISSLLENISYFFTNNGSIFIGENSAESISNNKICLQAHMDHPGGNLYFSKSSEYMYSKIYGKSMESFIIGRKLGVFKPGNSECLTELVIEHCHKEKNGYLIVFFKGDQSLMENYKSEELVVHTHEPFEIISNFIMNWNLDDLLNAALIIYLLKYKKMDDKCYGLLTHNEEVGHNGLYEFLQIIVNKKLFFVSMDTIANTIKTNNEFGIRKNQGKTDLNKYIPNGINDLYDDKYKASIPFGRCEGVTLTQNSKPNISLFIKIKNFHNKGFNREAVGLSVLKDYEEFVITLINNIEVSYIKDILITSKNKFLNNIEIIDESDELKEIILSHDNYIDYLNKGLPRLKKIFSKYNLNVPNMDYSSYLKYSKIIKEKQFHKLNKEIIIDITNYLIEEINKIFNIDYNKLFFTKKIVLIQIILGNFNACNRLTPEHAIFISKDKVRDADLVRLLTHELTHFITADIWKSINLPREVKIYYDEGLAVNLSAKKCNISLQESLGLNKEKYNLFKKEKEKLKQWFNEYSTGNLFKLYKGDFHEFFVKKKLNHPFYANTNRFSRYGYFLSAHETNILLQEGNYYGKILCK